MRQLCHKSFRIGAITEQLDERLLSVVASEGRGIDTLYGRLPSYIKN